MFLAGVHPEDREAVVAAKDRALDPAGDGFFASEYRVIHRSTGEKRHVLATGHVTFENGQALRLVGTVQDITHHRVMEGNLRDAEQFARSIIDTVPTQVYIYNLQARQNTYLGPQIREFLGYEADKFNRNAATELALIIHPQDLPQVMDHYRQIARQAQDGPFSIAFRFRHADGSWRWFESREVVYRRDAAGTPLEVLGAALDVTKRRHSEAERELLVEELNHRLKNLFAVLHAVAAHSLRPECSASSWQAYEGRMMAISQAQDQLVQGNWQSIGFGDLAEAVLYPHRHDCGTNLRLSGPPLTISGSKAVTVAMALHELATNALKYGALGAPGGRVELGWHKQDADLVVTWCEHGPARPVHPANSAGLGGKVIASAARHGSVEYSFNDGWLTARFVLA